MNKGLVNSRFLNILLLIFLAGFLVLPKISLAEDFKNITLDDIEKYLELPADKVESLIRSLIDLFNSEWINQISSAYSTAEESAVPNIMRAVARAQALNHLLIDAPIEITWRIINNAVKISRLLITQDISVIFEELEKESVRKATEYGMKFLLQNEIRVTPGAIEFRYISQRKEEKIALFQYVMIYQPTEANKGKLVIRFYSPNYLEIPKNQGNITGTTGFYTELTHDLPPFIVDIQGTVENYRWKGNPSIKITFPDLVPDLGIRPLSFWEKYVLKPIQTTIKEIEIIITKVTGGSTKIVENLSKISKIATDIWNTIKSAVSQINPFGAGVVQPLFSLEQQNEETEEIEEVVDVKPQQPQEIGGPEPPSLEELQEKIDDLLEMIDLTEAEIAKLTQARNIQKESKEEKITEESTNEEIEKLEETEETEETEEEELGQEEIGQDIGQRLCEKTGGAQLFQNKIIFNEIAWMGSVNSSNDEWIELKNISGNEINLAGWQILSKSDNVKIIFSRGRTSASSFFLLERIDDESVPGAPADLIYTGALKNSDEVLYLFDENCQLQDEVLASPNWPAGDNSSKRTMERKSDFSWQTSINSGGTPKAENSSGYVEYYSGGGAPPPPSPPPTTPLYLKILISEIQINTTASSSYDFIELYNSNNFDVDISDLQLKKRASTGSEDSIRVFPSGSKILAQKYFLWANSTYAASGLISADATSSQTLAKDNSIALFDKNGNLLDSLAWGSSTNPFVEGSPFSQNPGKDQSLGRRWIEEQGYQDIDDNSNDFEIQNPTPGAQNQSPANQPPTASFTFSPQNPSMGDEIIFDASSSTDPDGAITSFIWDFGDGVTATTSQAFTTYSYSTSGVEYLVELLVVDNQGATSSTSTTLTITERPALSVVINEIAWMGTKASAWDEWIEFYNVTTSTIDLLNWTLSIAQGTSTFPITISSPTTTIPAYGLYLLERAEKATNIPADFVYGGERISNGGAKIELRDSADNLIDIVDFSDRKSVV